MGKIVDVKHVSNGKNRNSTLYRITKKRRKKVSNNLKRPKMLQQSKPFAPKITTPESVTKTHKSNSMYDDTTKVNLKRVKKRRLKGGRKIDDSKDLSKKRN